jgi:transcriptional regulator with XRE-family HTH domain
MSDVLQANRDDEMFWRPTERTEAQAPEVPRCVDPRILEFLGSRVRSFRPSSERVVVFWNQAPLVDAWAHGESIQYNSSGAMWMLYSGWEAAPTAQLVGLIQASAEPVWGRVSENPPVDMPDDDVAPTDIEGAVASIKELLGLTDKQLEAATGISRSTLWRMRTGRTSETRSVTEAPVWRLYALTRALTSVLGADGAKGWLHAGDPSPSSLLAEGGLADVERRAGRIIFPDPATPMSFAGVADDDYIDGERAVVEPLSPRRPPRRVLRAPKTK